jgi:hypothetical protein
MARRRSQSSRKQATSPGRTTAGVDDVASFYLAESRLPLASLVLVAPLLLVYELGILWLGPEAMRNGAEVWLRVLLDWVGLGEYLLLPLVTVGLLLAWQHMTARPWRVHRGVLAGMVVEALALAILLLVVARLQGSLFAAVTLATSGADQPLGGPVEPSRLGLIISYCGAGLYEELLFRLMLLPVVIGLLRLCGLAPRGALTVAAVLTSLLFAALHYSILIPQGDPFELRTFTFRFLAGLFFAVLFLLRGFGIAAATHALYDMLVGLQ